MLRYPWVLFGILLCAIGNTILERLYWPTASSPGRTIIPYLTIYVVLLLLSLSLSLFLQPHWRTSSSARIDQSHYRACHSFTIYQQLLSHDYEDARRDPPFASYDQSFGRTLLSCNEKLTIIYRPLTVNPDLFAQRRGLWVLSLCNLLMPWAYLQARQHLTDLDLALDSLERDLDAARGLYQAICELHHPIIAELSVLDEQLQCVARKLETVGNHTLLGMQPHREELATCLVSYRSAHRRCSAYGLYPNSSQTWPGLTQAYQQIEGLRLRIAALATELDAIEHCREAYLKERSTCFRAYNDFQNMIIAEDAASSSVSTHRHRAVAQKIYEKLKAWSDLRGPKEHYEAARAAYVRIRQLISSECDHLQRKRQALRALSQYEDKLRAVSNRLDQVCEHTGGMEDAFDERREAHRYLVRCRVLLCDIVSDSWEAETEPERMVAMVDRRIEQITAAIDQIDALRAQRQELWLQIRWNCNAIATELDAAERRAAPIETLTFRERLAAYDHELTAAEREHGSTQRYLDQLGRAQAIVQELAQLGVHVCQKCELLDAILAYEQQLDLRRESYRGLRVLLPDGWQQIESQIAEIGAQLVAWLDLLKPQATQTQFSAQRLAQPDAWLSQITSDSCKLLIEVPLAQLDAIFAQIEQSYANYQAYCQQVETRLEQLDRLIEAPRPDPIGSLMSRSGPIHAKSELFLDPSGGVAVAEFRTASAGAWAHLVAIKDATISAEAIATSIGELVAMEAHIKRRRRELRLKMRLLHLTIGFDIERARLEKDISQITHEAVHAGIDEAIGSRQPVEKALYGLRARLTTPDGDWLPLLRDRSWQRQLRASLGAYRARLDDVRTRWQALSRLLEEAKGAIRAFRALHDDPVEQRRQVSLAEFAPHLNSWQDTFKSIEQQFKVSGNPKEYATFDQQLRALIVEAQAQKERLELKRALIRQIYVRLDKASELDMALRERPKLIHLLSESRGFLDSARMELRYGLERLTSASSEDWAKAMTAKWLDDEVQKRFGNIEEEMKATDDLDRRICEQQPIMERIKQTLGDPGLQQRLGMNGMVPLPPFVVNTEDIEDACQKLLLLIDQVERERQKLYQMTIGKADRQAPGLIKDYQRIADSERLLIQILRKRQRLVTDVHQKAQQLKNDLEGFEAELRANEQKIDFVSLKGRVHSLKTLIVSAEQRVAKSTNNQAIEQLLAFLSEQDAQSANTAHPPSLSRDKDSLTLLRRDYSTIIDAYNDLYSLGGYPVTIDLLYQALRKNASELAEDITQLSSILDDLRDCIKHKQLRDSQILSNRQDAHKYIQKLSETFNRLFRSAAERAAHWKKELGINSDTSMRAGTWRCLKPGYDELNSQLQKMRPWLSDSGKTTIESQKELDQVSDALSKFYVSDHQLREEYTQLQMLSNKLAQGIQSVKPVPAEQKADLLSEVQSLYQESQQSEPFLTAQSKLQEASSLLEEAHKKYIKTLSMPPYRVPVRRSTDGDDHTPAV